MKKTSLLFTGMLALALVFAFALTGCSSGPEPAPTTQPTVTTQPAITTQPAATTPPAATTEPSATTQPTATTQPASATQAPAYADYFGTWQDEHARPYTVTITENELKFDMTPSNRGTPRYYTIEITSWTPLSNPVAATRDGYPSGYAIRGRIIESIGDTTNINGTQSALGATVTTYYFINNDKNTMMGGNISGAPSDELIYFKR